MFHVALGVGVLFALPYIYLKVNKRSLATEVAYRFSKQESSAITPDIGGYRPTRPGEKFSASDYVHFKLEYLNAVIGALPEYREKLAYFVFVRYSVPEKTVKEFLRDPEHKRAVESFLKDNPKWARKIELAEKEAAEKKIRTIF